MKQISDDCIFTKYDFYVTTLCMSSSKIFIKDPHQANSTPRSQTPSEIKTQHTPKQHTESREVTPIKIVINQKNRPKNRAIHLLFPPLYQNPPPFKQSQSKLPIAIPSATVLLSQLSTRFPDLPSTESIIRHHAEEATLFETSAHSLYENSADIAQLLTVFVCSSSRC